MYNEKLDISLAMQKCKGRVFDAIDLDIEEEKSLIDIIEKNREEFLNFMHKIGLHVEHHSLTSNYKNSATTILTLKTTCFKVDFNDNFVTIAPLK